MCILCPRRYEEKLVPNYKNPKLLSQFISPHTGRVYQSHITGLCAYMQVSYERFNYYFIITPPLPYYIIISKMWGGEVTRTVLFVFAQGREIDELQIFMRKIRAFTR